MKKTVYWSVLYAENVNSSWPRILYYCNFYCCVSSADLTESWNVSSSISDTQFDTKIFSIWIELRISLNWIRSRITTVQIKSLPGPMKSWELLLLKLHHCFNQIAIWICPPLSVAYIGFLFVRYRKFVAESPDKCQKKTKKMPNGAKHVRCSINDYEAVCAVLHLADQSLQ